MYSCCVYSYCPSCSMHCLINSNSNNSILKVCNAYIIYIRQFTVQNSYLVEKQILFTLCAREVPGSNPVKPAIFCLLSFLILLHTFLKCFYCYFFIYYNFEIVSNKFISYCSHFSLNILLYLVLKQNDLLISLIVTNALSHLFLIFILYWFSTNYITFESIQSIFPAV